ncbi:RHS repeat-associated core domain-containing protein [Candidatus Microgenomates bacterium]|nr:RHS repeat-associated core domain-containing protein [Candidatus Microgenomates bacterium]
MKKYFLKVLSFFLVFSFFLQPFALVSPISAETIDMQYTDPDHLHAPKKVNETDYQYDSNGNLVNDGEREIFWNQDNLPIKIIKGDTEVIFFYDANGNRIIKKIGENKTIYISSSYQKSTIDGQETATKYYFANGRVAQLKEDNLSFLHQDHLGSTVLATNSNSESLGETLSYFPYGNTISNSQLAIRYFYTGQESDNETGLYNYNARLYNPKTGAFISADIVQGLNRYAYAANNPIMFTDPSGHYVPEERSLYTNREYSIPWYNTKLHPNDPRYRAGYADYVSGLREAQKTATDFIDSLVNSVLYIYNRNPYNSKLKAIQVQEEFVEIEMYLKEQAMEELLIAIGEDPNSMLLERTFLNLRRQNGALKKRHSKVQTLRNEMWNEFEEVSELIEQLESGFAICGILAFIGQYALKETGVTTHVQTVWFEYEEGTFYHANLFTYIDGEKYIIDPMATLVMSDSYYRAYLYGMFPGIKSEIKFETISTGL